MSSPNLLILDTHIWVWWMQGAKQLPRNIRRLIDEGQEPVAISSVSIYEAVLQMQRGRLVVDLPLDEWIFNATTAANIAILALAAEIAARAGVLPLHHGDPLDRIIIASTVQHDAMLASVDAQFPAYEALDGRLITGKESAQ